MNNIVKRLAVFVTAGALSVAGTGFAAPALAQEIGAETSPSAAENADTINPTEDIELVINKRLGDPTKDGTTDGTTALEGITFKIEKVNDVDLTTQKGWETAANLTADKATDTTEIGEVVTNAQGTASMTTQGNPEFKVGLYKVTEVQAGNYTAAAPFLVALPHSEGGAWNYSRTVFPKNQEIIPSKQVDDTNATIGSTLGYTINAPVPAGDLSHFAVSDPLAPNLALVAEPIEVKAVGGQGQTVPPLNENDDYTVDTANNELRVEFTETGRSKLQDARKNDAGLKVTVGFRATVKSVPESGTITNTATIELPNDAKVDTDDGDRPTSTTFGDLTITKTTSNGDSSLDGAKFELYQCSGDETTGYQLLGNALKMATTQNGSPETTIVTTGSLGNDAGRREATANGYAIPISSFAAQNGITNNQYCVLETVAPEGYVRNPEPQPVTIDGLKLTAKVDNQKDSILGQLPATGAWGLLLIFLLGALLLARGIYTSHKDSRSAA